MEIIAQHSSLPTFPTRQYQHPLMDMLFQAMKKEERRDLNMKIVKEYAWFDVRVPASFYYSNGGNSNTEV